MEEGQVGASPPQGPATHIDAAWVEAVALRVVELLGRNAQPTTAGLVDATTLAAELGVERSWVYAHRAELGAISLGTGSKPRLRFDRETARKVLARSIATESQQPTPDARPRSASRRRRERVDRAGLLPIRRSAIPVDADGEPS